MKVLIVNDDGVHAEGIKLLTQSLLKHKKENNFFNISEIIVVAPNEEKSASSQKINIRDGHKFEQIEDIVEGVKTYSLDGSPADCVTFARKFMDYKFDYVFSGINNGPNLGNDIFYSGTVGAATEGSLLGGKAIALSVPRKDFTGVKYLEEVFEYIYNNDLMNICPVLNVNLVSESKGIKISHQGVTLFNTIYETKEGLHYPTGYYSPANHINDEYSDVFYDSQGYISITPLVNDRTNYELFSKLIKKV